jgi:CO/xanthine dehydrogenase Mo-binding subunit
VSFLASRSRSAPEGVGKPVRPREDPRLVTGAGCCTDDVNLPGQAYAVLSDYIGPHKIMWATDYPHSDGFFPGAPQMLRDRLKTLSPEAQH